MGYYNVLILTRKDKNGHDYQSESLWFGESLNKAKTSFYDAVRKAQEMPDAEYVVVWHDMGVLFRVRIEH